MANKTEKDLWVEMSVDEIVTQSQYANISYSQIDRKAAASNAALFSSIHSFLSHCGMISKMLKATDDSSPPKSIGGLLGVPDTSLIHHRVFRNHLEHYDERLKRWIQQFGPNCNIGMNNIGPKSKISFPGLVFVRHFDPTTGCFTFVNDEFDLKALHAEVGNIETIAQKWLEQVRQKRITHNI